MEQRSVLRNVSQFVRNAYQRAQIDRQPTAIFFWNETIRASTADDTEIVVGRAVAVRRSGRISRVQGQNLYDEFADLKLSYQTDDEESGGTNDKDTFYLYPMDALSDIESSGNIRRSTVESKVYKKTLALTYLSGTENKTEDSGDIETYTFQMKDQGGVTWKAGMAYGFEFANIELPHGYIFGQNYSTSFSDPVREAGTLVFDVGRNNGQGMNSSGAAAGLGSRTSIAVYSLRPDTSGNLAAQKVGDSEIPTAQ